jgi:hypothetical protein
MDAQTKRLAKPLEDIFAKAPALPSSARELLVSVAPWISLVFGVLLVLVSLGGLGLGSFLGSFAMYAGAGNTMFLLVASILGIVQGAVMVLAFAPLKKRSITGWNWWFWAEIISVVAAVVAFNLLGAVINAVIGFYLIFQVRSYYK